VAHRVHGFRHGVSGVERLASREGVRELRVRLEERVERRGRELQELFGKWGLGVGARGLSRGTPLSRRTALSKRLLSGHWRRL
ncbi:MAG: hypothetical protein QXD46_01970, partial [Thermofilum sp.]